MLSSMKSDNLIQISGYLTRDAKANAAGTFASFSIAHKTGNADVMYFQCVIFSKDRKLPADLLLKGKEVFIKGFLRPNNYTKDGVAYSGFQIVAEKIRSANE